MLLFFHVNISFSKNLEESWTTVKDEKVSIQSDRNLNNMYHVVRNYFKNFRLYNLKTLVLTDFKYKRQLQALSSIENPSDRLKNFKIDPAIVTPPFYSLFFGIL